MLQQRPGWSDQLVDRGWANLPVSAGQLQNVLHSGVLEQVAAKAGIDPSQLTLMMSSLLPNVVDKLTPNGQVPDSGARK